MMLTTSYRRSVLRTFVVAAAICAALAPSATYASTPPVSRATHAFLGKAKMIHFSLRNQSGASVDLRAGEQVMTVGAGQTVELKLAAGTRIVTANRTDKREAGSVICEVSPTMNDTTLVMN